MLLGRCMLICASLLAGVLLAQSGPGATAPVNPVFQAMLKDARSRVRQISVKELEALIASGAKFRLLDIREDHEWAAGHAKAAQHIGRGVLDRDIEVNVPDKDTKIVVYCAGGSRSALAADLLQKMGYTDVSSLAGGYSGYTAAGLPTEK